MCAVLSAGVYTCLCLCTAHVFRYECCFARGLCMPGLGPSGGRPAGPSPRHPYPTCFLQAESGSHPGKTRPGGCRRLPKTFRSAFQLFRGPPGPPRALASCDSFASPLPASYLVFPIFRCRGLRNPSESGLLMSRLKSRSRMLELPCAAAGKQGASQKKSLLVSGTPMAMVACRWPNEIVGSA